MRGFLLCALPVLGLSATIKLKDGPGDGLAKTTYSGSDPLPGLAFMMKYFPVSDAEDSCEGDVCTCEISGETYEVQQGRAQLITSDYPYAQGIGEPEWWEGFGLHLVNCSTNPQPGGMTTQEVEAEFNSKLGDMSSFDAFMDYNVALYTADLDLYVTQFDADAVDYLPVSWYDQEVAYYGVMLQVPNSQMVIEMMSKNSSLLAQRATHRLEQRASTSALRRAEARIAARIAARRNATSATDLLTVISVGRAASDISAIDEFYSNGMQCSTTLSIDEDDVTKRCYLWEAVSATADVCFTVRDDSATAGDFKVSDFEDMLNTVHANIMASGSCNNKWMDNHYAVDGHNNADFIVEYVESNDIYYYCEASSLHYIVDPTGWGIQLDITFSTQPSKCNGFDAPRIPNADFCPCTGITSCGQGSR